MLLIREYFTCTYNDDTYHCLRVPLTYLLDKSVDTTTFRITSACLYKPTFLQRRTIARQLHVDPSKVIIH